MKLTLLLLFIPSLLFSKALLTERKHIPHSIDTSLRVDSSNAEKMLIRVVYKGNRRCYSVNGKLFNTKRKIKNNLDYTIPVADNIRRSTNAVGIGLGFSIVTVIPGSKLLGVPLWGGGLNRRDKSIDRYNSYIIRKFGLEEDVEKFFDP